MNFYDELNSMINGLERATSVCTETEALSLYEAVNEYFRRSRDRLDEDECTTIERRLDDAKLLIDVRSKEVEDADQGE